MFPGEAEVLDTRPPRPGRPWVAWLAAALVAAAVVAVLVERAGGSGGPAPTATRTARASPSPFSPPPVRAAVVLSSDIAFDRIGDTVYAVDGRDLITVDLDTGRRFRWRPVEPAAADQYRLLADPARRQVWLIAGTGERTVVSFLDPTTLARIGLHVTWGRFVDATLLDGRLYVATSRGVDVVSQSAEVTPRRPPAVPAGVLAIAADPQRHRLLVVQTGERSLQLSAWAVSGRHPLVQVPAPFVKGQLVEAGGHLWAVGFGNLHAVVALLDPTTLRAVAHSLLERELGPGAVAVASNPRYLLVRSDGSPPGNAGAELSCVDATTGQPDGGWGDTFGTPVMTDAGVVLLPAGQALLRLGSCGK